MTKNNEHLKDLASADLLLKNGEGGSPNKPTSPHGTGSGPEIKDSGTARMEWLRRYRVFYRILVPTFAALVSILAIGILTDTFFFKKMDVLQEKIKGRFLAYEQSQSIYGKLHLLQMNAHTLVSWKNTNYGVAQIKELASAQPKIFEELKNNIEALKNNKQILEKEKAILVELEKKGNTYEKLYLEFIDLLDGDSAFLTLFIPDFDDKFNHFVGEVKILQELEYKFLQEQEVSNREAISNLKIMYFIMFISLFFLCSLLSVVMAKSILGPINSLIYFCKGISQGEDLGRIKISEQSKDEFATLANSMNYMLDVINEKSADLESKHVQLRKRNEEVETIYKNVQTGFMLCDVKANIQPGYSHSCRSLLSKEQLEGSCLPDILGLSEREKAHFICMLEQVFEDFLPEALSLDQLPSKFNLNNKTVQTLSRAIRDEGGSVIAILFTLNDVTELQKAELENLRNRDIIKILRKKEDFIDFVGMCKKSIEDCMKLVATSSQMQLRFIIHTIKGNASVFGLGEFVQTVHEIEDQDQIYENDIMKMDEVFRKYLRENYEILNVVYDDEIKKTYLISESELETIKSQVVGKEFHKIDIKRIVLSWIHELTLKKFEDAVFPLVQLGIALSKRLGKEIDFEVAPTSEKVDPELLRPLFQVLPHLIRNAVDHGVEKPTERKNKPRRGKIRFEWSFNNSFFELKISDDGKGINVDLLGEKVIQRGIITSQEFAKMSDKEKLNLIFKDGVSTAQKVTDLSGRGVGMSSVLEVVQEMGGDIQVDSKLGSGTVFQFRIPVKNSQVLQLAA